MNGYITTQGAGMEVTGNIYKTLNFSRVWGQSLDCSEKVIALSTSHMLLHKDSTSCRFQFESTVSGKEKSME